MINGDATITLKGTEHKIVLPPFAEREDLIFVYNEEAKRPRRRQRALVAALGLCCPSLGFGLSAFEDADLDVVRFGGRVYSALMEAGNDRGEVYTAANNCLFAVCGALFPREFEVAAKANFTEADAEPPTAQP